MIFSIFMQMRRIRIYNEFMQRTHEASHMLAISLLGTSFVLIVGAAWWVLRP